MSTYVVHVGYSGEIEFRFVDADGDPVGLSAADQIALEIFDEPGTPLVAFNTVDDAELFDTTALATGLLKHAWQGDTYSEELLNDRTTCRHKARLIVTTENWPEPGFVVPNYLDVLFSR